LSPLWKNGVFALIFGVFSIFWSLSARLADSNFRRIDPAERIEIGFAHGGVEPFRLFDN